MKIKKFNSEFLSSLEINLSNAGIYLLKGENGSGKTTFLEKIAKEDLVVEKNNISYSPQLYMRYSCSVKEYFLKSEYFQIGKSYMEDMGLHLSGSENMMNLSGGEFIKVNLSRNFALEKSVILLDEPTNSLDDESVEALKKILLSLAEKKILIISSHDERLDFEEIAGIFEIKNNELIFEDTNKVSLIDKDDSKKTSYPIIRNLFNSSFNKQFFFLVAIVSFMALSFTARTIYYTFPLSDSFKDNGYLELINVGEQNSSYFKASQSEEAMSKTEGYDYLDFDEMKELSQKSYVENIYYIDDSYFNQISDDNEELNIISLPNVIANSPSYTTAFPGSKVFLIQGRIPQDGSQEAMISYQQMNKFFGYTGSENQMIGQKITVDNRSYQIVGISKLPYTVLAFDEKADYGFIKFIGDKELEDRRIAALKKEGYIETASSVVVIEYDHENNEELMHFINENARSYQASSNYVNNFLMWQTYRENIIWIFFLSLSSGVIGSLIILYFGKKAMVSAKALINDAVNITLDSKEVYAKVSLVVLFDFMIIIPLVLLNIGTMFGFDFLLLILPSLFIIVSVMSLSSYFSLRQVKFD